MGEAIITTNSIRLGQIKHEYAGRLYRDFDWDEGISQWCLTNLGYTPTITTGTVDRIFFNNADDQTSFEKEFGRIPYLQVVLKDSMTLLQRLCYRMPI